MGEPKFTPGPWQFHASSSDHHIHCVTAHLPSGPRIEVCEVWGTEVDTIETEQSRANAHLIAAAPALFEALGELLPNCGWANYSDKELQLEADLGNGMAPFLLRARFALAQALGEPTQPPSNRSED